MRTILDLTYNEALEFLLKPESYCSFELPEYFNFQSLISTLSTELKGKKIQDCHVKSPKNQEDVNLVLLNNKDGQFAWRPFQLIHPALYVSLTHNITHTANWDIIKLRFAEFQQNEKIECHSTPVVSEDEKSDKQSQIYEWWKKIEQRSLTLALDYNHVLHLDISIAMALFIPIV